MRASFFFLVITFFYMVHSNAGVLFKDNFDSHPDWQTSGRKKIASLPKGWDYGRTDERWHPADGDIGTKPSMMINGNDPTQVFGGVGKSFITYSESYNDLTNNGFTSDGQLSKNIPPTNELYVRFKIKFQPGWVSNDDNGLIKIFRAAHFDGGKKYKFFPTGNFAPIYIYDWSQNRYGVRHFHAFRCDPQLSNYYCKTPNIPNSIREVISGDMSTNFTSDIAKYLPLLPDYRTGGILPRSGIVFHNQVLSDAWHTMEFYIKLNSAPGVVDGILKHWLDGELIADMTMPWIGIGGDISAKWNTFSIGGNDRFHFNLKDEPKNRERWYAIDNIEVHEGVLKILCQFLNLQHNTMRRIDYDRYIRF